MTTKESQIVEITSREELDKFMVDFANGGEVGAERNGNRCFVYTPDKIAEIKPVFRRDIKEAQRLLDYVEICFGTPRTSAQLQLNESYGQQ